MSYHCFCCATEIKSEDETIHCIHCKANFLVNCIVPKMNTHQLKYFKSVRGHKHQNYVCAPCDKRIQQFSEDKDLEPDCAVRFDKTGEAQSNNDSSRNLANSTSTLLQKISETIRSITISRQISSHCLCCEAKIDKDDDTLRCIHCKSISLVSCITSRMPSDQLKQFTDRRTKIWITPALSATKHCDRF